MSVGLRNPQSFQLYTVSCSFPESPYGLPDLLLGWHWPHAVRFLLQLFSQRRTASGVPQANQTQQESSFSLMTHFLLHLIHAGTKMECFVIVGATAILFGNLHWSWYGCIFEVLSYTRGHKKSCHVYSERCTEQLRHLKVNNKTRGKRVGL